MIFVDFGSSEEYLDLELVDSNLSKEKEVCKVLFLGMISSLLPSCVSHFEEILT